VRLDRGGLDADLGVDAHRLLEMAHGRLQAAGRLQQVGQPVVQGRLPMSVALGDGQSQRLLGQHQRGVT
jgi:hypothetical protein